MGVVQGRRGRRASSVVVFLLILQVVAIGLAPGALAAPAVSSCTPMTGPVGTSVTITGTDLAGVNRVEFNGADATFTVNQAGTQIIATVPSGATTGPLTVTDNGANGGTASCGTFTVTPAQTPTVTGFAPASGPVGTSVVITGTNFTGATAVRFGSISATFTVNSPTQITATVPLGAIDAPISVQNTAGTGTSSANFDVTAQPAPTVTGFSPTSGPVGTTVVITGTNFTGATAVRFGGTAATTFTVNSSTQITATVPSGANTGAISVTTASGTGTSSSSFVVTAGAPTISSFTPTSGCSGTSVTINGTGFTGATGVTFNGVAATYTVQSSTRIVATVPIGATTGKIAVTGPNGTGTSATNFTVTQCAPRIISFSPANGPVGSTVTITGDDFTGTVTVRFDGVNAAFTVNSDNQITATVPTGADTGRITITNAIGTGTSATDFIVTAQPTITGFSPTSGPVGTSVVITGTNFTAATTVTFGGVAAQFTVNSSTRITATVPTGATTGRIAVTNSAGTATSANDFTVAPTPAVNSFSPARGPVGTEVVITGSNFTGATAVRFDGVIAEFTVDSPTQITAVVPEGAGDGPITVTNLNGTASSLTDFQVQERYARAVALRLTGHLTASGAVVTSVDFEACEVGVAVKIQRRRDGVWRTLKIVTTDATGEFSTTLRDRQGRYRAVVSRIDTDEYICGWARSPGRIHTH